MTVSVCIFAHNEERCLPECIGALDAAAGDEPYEVHLMVNGCTDNTARVARSLGAADQRITIQELPVADKANAWNDYVHRIAPQANAHIFIDGDVQPSDTAISALAAKLRDHPSAYAAAALPASGRSRKQWATKLFMDRHLSGNLYAMSNRALNLFRERSIRLPFGAKGEDGVLAYLLLTNLKGGEDDTHDHRIVVSGDATFEFHTLGFRARDVKAYHRRLIRYSERHFQKKVLYTLLKQGGVKAMPDNIYDIYKPSILARISPRFDPVNYWYDLATRRRLSARR
ncbi:MAG: glycosyltransferase [Pseudomonadota bacterium]